MDACLGDLLTWDAKPTKDAALRGYIIKSRIKESSNIMLAQPYSPELFSQGVLQGPDLLMKVLLKEITFEEAKAAWKRIEKDKEEKDAAASGPWMLNIPLACRRCTDLNDGVEIKKPVSAFTTAQKPEEIWRLAISFGQDFQVYNPRGLNSSGIRI